MGKVTHLAVRSQAHLAAKVQEDPRQELEKCLVADSGLLLVYCVSS